MNFQSKETHQSRLEGVSFTTRRIGPALRAQLAVKTSGAMAKLREEQRKLDAFESELIILIDASERDGDGIPVVANEPAKASPEMWRLADSISTIRDEMSAITRAEIAPVWFEAAVMSVDGLSIDEVPATVQDVCQYGPDELFHEILDALAERLHIPGVVAKNLQSPTTSNPRGDGQATNETSGSVDAANSRENTSEETAGDISPSLHAAA